MPYAGLLARCEKLTNHISALKSKANNVFVAVLLDRQKVLELEWAWRDFIASLNGFGVTSVLDSGKTLRVNSYSSPAGPVSGPLPAEYEVVQALRQIIFHMGQLVDVLRRVQNRYYASPFNGYSQLHNAIFRTINCVDIVWRMAKVYFDNLPVDNFADYERAVNAIGGVAECFGAMTHEIILPLVAVRSCRGYDRHPPTKASHYLQRCFDGNILMCAVVEDGAHCACAFGCKKPRPPGIRPCQACWRALPAAGAAIV